MEKFDPKNHPTGDPELDTKLAEWFKFDQYPSSRTAIAELLKSKKIPELRSLLSTRLTFGTAGIRGRMGPGYARLNDLVIIQTSQGLVTYLLSIHEPGILRKNGVIVGHDARHNSRRFALRTAAAFIGKQIPVHLYSTIVPTPFVPFGVRQLSALAGIMVTASHNPKDDNGYKVYFANGAQIIPPHDEGIQAAIDQQLVPWPNAWTLPKAEDVCDPLAKVMGAYYAQLDTRLLNRELLANSELHFTYTTLHGVGHDYVTKALKGCGLKHYHPVKEQMTPDPEFPTVPFPNPEEGKGVLNLSIKTAEATGSEVILANDPDVDRLGVAERQEDATWRLFTGNEVGALLGWWLLHKHRARMAKEVKGQHKKVVMLASAVSSKILQSMATKEGFEFVETLTGFKWMGNLAIGCAERGCEVLFAFEEAIGYMCGLSVPDKDGISAAVEIAELAVTLRASNSSISGGKVKRLSTKLDEIYEQYGFHSSLNSYYLCYDQKVISSIFERLANFEGNGNYPKKIGEYKIRRVRDLNRGYDSETSDNKPVLPCSSSAFMLTLYFENGVILTIRTSGTEPKIKYYSEIIAKPEEKDWSIVRKRLQDTIALVVQECLQPEKNNLKPKPE